MGEIGSMFVGVGVMMVCAVLSYLFYQWCRFSKQLADLEELETAFEIATIEKIAKKKGIDLRKEIEKEKLFRVSKHNFRRKLKQEMYEEMFGKEEKKE